MGFWGTSVQRLGVIFVMCLAVMVEFADTQFPGIHCTQEKPLGMENGAILNSQITVSSVLSSQYGGHEARLHNKGAWYARTTDKTPWIQVDLGWRRTVTKIAIQGYASYIKEFYLQYGDDVNKLNFYTQNGATKKFPGNVTPNDVKNITISPPIIGRYIKLHVTQLYQYCTLRMEIYGCDYTSSTLPPTMTPTTTSGPVSCRTLLVPQGSIVACLKGSSIGSVCNFTCQSGYTLMGNHQLSCRSDGTWDYHEPACYRRPGKVSGVQILDVLENAISISWKKPVDGSSVVKDYQVYWKAAGSHIPMSKVVVTNSASVQVRPYILYDIMVKAQNSYGYGPWSDMVTIRSAEAAPTMTPPNFQVTSQRSLELTVSWRPIPSEGQNGVIKGYNVYFYRNDNPAAVITKPLGPATYTCTLSNLEYAAYYVRVAGYTSIGNGPKTDRLRKTPMEGAPLPPRNLVAFAQSSTSVLLKWLVPEKLNGVLRKYVVRFGTLKDQMVNSRQIDGPANSSMVTSLEEFTTYYFHVYAETSVTGQPSNIVSATTHEDAPDALPTLISEVSRDAYSIYVSWRKVPSINCNGIVLGYTVFYKVSGQAVPRNVTFYDETKLSTELTGLIPFTSYCIKIAAFTRVGMTKDWDNSKCKWTTTLETGPSAPVDLKGQAKSSIEVFIEWKMPKNPNGLIDSYVVYYGPLKDNLNTKISVTKHTLSTVITGLRKFTTYYFQVRGKTSKPGNASEVIAVTTKEDVPSAPLALSCREASPDSNVLSWNQPTEINGVLRSYIITTYENRTGKQVGQPINQTAYLLDNPKRDIVAYVPRLKPYRFYVHTIQAYTIGYGPSTNCTIRTMAGVPSAPQDVEAKLIDMSIHVNWKEPLERNGVLNAYMVYCTGTRSYQRTFIDPQIFEVDSNTLSYKVTRLAPGTDYTIYIAANTAVGEGDKSETIFITTPSKAPPAPEQPSFSTKTITSSTIVIYLYSSPTTNGNVIAHQIIVGKRQKRTRRSSDNLPSDIGSYSEAQKAGSSYYIAAEFVDGTLPKQFTLGDGETYSGYHNAPLEPNTDYDVFVRGVTKDEDGRWIYGEPSRASPPATKKAEKLPPSSDSSVGIIAGIVGALLLIAIIIIGVFLYRRSKRPLKANVDVENQRSKSKRRIRDLELRRLAGKKRSSSGEVGNDPEHPSVPVDHFAKHVHKLHKSDDRGFMIEYNKLDGGREFPCDVAYSQDNKSKNRYGNIVAYDHSRVVLSVLENDPSSDYINASHVDGYNKPNGYIATQGPIPPTFNDFWRMVWEQQSSTIVMLTNLQERHKLKCHKYWPDETEDYGDIAVQLLRSEHYADYSIRTFNVKRDAEKEEREVKQFHFIVWPDHGVPEYPTAILAFRRRVRAYNPPDAGPVIVHCSAGVGRSGTFIVIDAMLDRVNAESTLDIFNYVAYLRSRRTAMVQTEEQYTFCHDAILESIQCGNTQILAHDLRITLSRMENVDKDLKMTRFESEFKTLNKCSPVLPKACYIVASYPESKEKNRYPDILASDFSRVVLTAIDDNEITTYINAVHISGYKQQHAFIITQYPLSATITDYWRMLCEQESACIVVFQPAEEGDFPQFWPEVGTETYDDMITVQCSDEKSGSVDNLKSCYDQSEISELRFKVKDLRTPEKVLKVKMFMVHGWANEEAPPPTSAMITLTAKVERWQQQSGNGPITVVCSDGIGRSGTFCALYSVLERVKIEQVVDVLQAIKAMRIPRPGLVKTTAEYKFIHYAVQEYLTAFDDYANFK